MKLIIKQYLASLNEREELDAILPDLLSQLGLNVFSRPRRGTRQDGVDVAAVGSLDGTPEKVYLFSIKAGDLTRESWDGDAIQSLRASLNEIIDAYIPNRLPNEHTGKEIVVCLCFGGDIQEQVRPQVEGYIKSNNKEHLTFEEWNGDKLASLIQTSFLREDLLPQNARSELRKSLALLDEPEASYKHFSALIESFSHIEIKKEEPITIIRQIHICLWILYAWGRDAQNIESAYLSSELAVLYCWNYAKSFFSTNTKKAKAVKLAFNAVLVLYLQISYKYLTEKILPYADKRHTLSVAIQPSCSLDINLRLFDVLGRLALGGLWAYRNLQNADEQDPSYSVLLNQVQLFSAAIRELISNNPALLLPIKDDQAIDIFIAVLLLSTDVNNHNFIKSWLLEIVNRSTFSYEVRNHYPCIISSYYELLKHPQNKEDYFQEVTSGSILFPMIALWAALFRAEDLYNNISSLKERCLKHCNFQLWYPDESSEEHFYTNKDTHGGILSHLSIERPSVEYLKKVFEECDNSPYFESLSAIKASFWPIILVSCRHYRIPIPVDLFKGFQEENQIS